MPTRPHPARAPAISVVVTGRGDAAARERTVRSVLDQTLRGVEAVVVADDTDPPCPRGGAGDPERHRVRWVRLPADAAGAGRMRNAGLDHARGDHVMFLDAGDVLSRHACMTLLDAAERTGADVVSAEGRPPTGTPAPTTLLRRAFLDARGLRFPDGRTAGDAPLADPRVLASARITVIPHRLRRSTGVAAPASRRGRLRWAMRRRVARWTRRPSPPAAPPASSPRTDRAAPAARTNRVAAAAPEVRSGPAGRPPRARRRRPGRAWGRSAKVWTHNVLLTRLPVRPRSAVFESHGGRRYAGNPKYIYEELRRADASIRAIWVYSEDRDGFPTDARLVRRHSWAYYLAVARARYWVDDQGFPADLRKRRGTTYIQGWRGSPAKRVGFDHPVLKRADEAAHRRAERAAARVDHLLVRSEHDVRTLLGALRIRGEPVRCGYPRNDPLIGGGDPQAAEALRHALGLSADDDRAVVLYAPTFRRDAAGRIIRRFRSLVDLDRFAAELGDTHLLLVRPHPLCAAGTPARRRRAAAAERPAHESAPAGAPARGPAHEARPTARAPILAAARDAGRAAVLDVGHLHDNTPLLLLADALITDYSAVMFDYALLDRPMIFHVPDLAAYVRREGLSFDLARTAPGPLTRDSGALFAALRDLAEVRERYAARRRGFAERYGAYDTGTAAKEVVARLFAEPERRP